MPKPTNEHLENLGDSVLPFQRTGFKRKVLKGEDNKDAFLPFIYDATEDGFPTNVLLAQLDDIINGKAELQKYLWIINQNGLFILPEQTINKDAERGVVCHTNITGGEKAIQGGELWFCIDGAIYINNKSGRYGATTLKERQAILEYFQYVGYNNVKQII